jgi:hypothetical protein
VKLVKVNVDTSPQISQRFEAQAIPDLAGTARRAGGRPADWRRPAGCPAIVGRECARHDRRLSICLAAGAGPRPAPGRPAVPGPSSGPGDRSSFHSPRTPRVAMARDIVPRFSRT